MPEIFESFKKGTGVDSSDIRVKEVHYGALMTRQRSSPKSLKCQ